MKTERLQELIELTDECIRRFWQLDVEFAIQYFDKDILWIGSAKSQYLAGYDAVVEDFRTIRDELIPCHLLHQVYTVANHSRSTCAIVGRYLTTSDDGTGCFLQAEQRATFIWEDTRAKGLRIKHIHISNPMGELALAGDERVPNQLNERTKQYILYQIAGANGGKAITLVDRNDNVHFLSRSDILYAKACGRYVDLYTIKGELVPARMSITEFIEKAGEDFFPIHRSYVVNTLYVILVNRKGVHLINGHVLPVPEKRYTIVKDELLRRNNQELW